MADNQFEHDAETTQFSALRGYYVYFAGVLFLVTIAIAVALTLLETFAGVSGGTGVAGILPLMASAMYSLAHFAKKEGRLPTPREKSYLLHGFVLASLAVTAVFMGLIAAADATLLDLVSSMGVMGLLLILGAVIGLSYLGVALGLFIGRKNQEKMINR